MPELLQTEDMGELKQLAKDFSAANTMALVFVTMELIILYVGTNRFRPKPTFFSIYSKTQVQQFTLWVVTSSGTTVTGSTTTSGTSSTHAACCRYWLKLQSLSTPPKPDLHTCPICNKDNIRSSLKLLSVFLFY